MSNLPVYLLEDSTGKGLVLFSWSQHSSLFRKLICQFGDFCNYVNAYYVIGHDVIGHPKVGTDNSGLGLYGTETRLVLYGLEEILWPN